VFHAVLSAVQDCRACRRETQSQETASQVGGDEAEATLGSHREHPPEDGTCTGDDEAAAGTQESSADT
jgi:hypothetical protein